MISRQEFLAYCDEILDSKQIEDYCTNGLQVEGNTSINKIAASVSATLESIEKAIEMKADCLLTHHGLFWKNQDYLVIGPLQKKLKRALESGLNLISYHLPLDISQEFGNNYLTAKHLGLKNLRPFDVGTIGVLEDRDIQSFYQKCQSFYKKEGNCALFGPKRVGSCAVISGCAHKDFIDAIEQKVDCFITGSFDEPNWHLAKEHQVHFMSFGHDTTEQIGIKTFAGHLAKKFGLDWEFIDLDCPF